MSIDSASLGHILTNKIQFHL